MNIKHPVNTQKVNILGNARLTIQYVRVLHLQNHSTHTHRLVHLNGRQGDLLTIF